MKNGIDSLSKNLIFVNNVATLRELQRHVYKASVIVRIANPS